MIVGREIASTGGCTHVVRSRVFLTRLPSVVGDQNKMWGFMQRPGFPSPPPSPPSPPPPCESPSPPSPPPPSPRPRHPAAAGSREYAPGSPRLPCGGGLESVPFPGDEEEEEEEEEERRKRTNMGYEREGGCKGTLRAIANERARSCETVAQSARSPTHKSKLHPTPAPPNTSTQVPSTILISTKMKSCETVCPPFLASHPHPTVSAYRNTTNHHQHHNHNSSPPTTHHPPPTINLTSTKWASAPSTLPEASTARPKLYTGGAMRGAHFDASK